VSKIQAAFADLGLQGRKDDHEGDSTSRTASRLAFRVYWGAMAYQSQLDRMNEKPEFN